MTTIEDKISLFSKIIHGKVNEEKIEAIAAFSKGAEKQISAEKEKIKELRRSIQIETAKKMKIKSNAIVAKEKISRQTEILSLKEKLIKDSLECVREKLVEFVMAPEYKPYLINNIQKTLKAVDKGHYNIMVVKRDYEKFLNEIGEIIKGYRDYNFEINISDDDFIGGHILKDFEGKFKIDNSIYSALMDSTEIIGVRVMEMLA